MTDKDITLDTEPPITLPSIEDTLNHPSYPTTVWRLVPNQKGLLPVAEGRGGPLNIAYEVHGNGDIKIILIMGLGSFKTAWQRQTLHFGHEHGDRYSVLLIDNRGMGDSDRPLMRYSTSEMARDVVEVADHLGWTAARQLHLVGISMGGMIAQELACLAPARVGTLVLCCTAAEVRNTTSWSENMANRASMVVPKTMEKSVANTTRQIFARDWLARPDDVHLPDPNNTPGVLPPESGGEYGLFSCNYQRFVAQEMHKRLDSERFTIKGFLLQLIAAGWHRKSREQLKEMADAVGRERITVLHGTEDNMITTPHGETLIEFIQPAVGIIKQGMGHAPVLEVYAWFNNLIEERIAVSMKLNEHVSVGGV